MLEPLGISPVAEQVYLRLLREPAVPDTAVSELPDVSDVEAQHCLAELTQAGLITRRADGQVVAAPPQIALEALIQRRVNDLECARISVAQLQEDYRQHVAGQAPIDVGDIVVGRDATARRFGQVIRIAQREVRCFEAPPYVHPPGIGPLEIDGLAAGVQCRTVYSRAALGAPHALAALKQHVEAGEQARTLPEVPLRMILADDRIALLPLVTGATGEVVSSLCIVAQPVVQALAALFELVWQRAWPIALGSGDLAVPSSVDDPVDLMGLPGVMGPEMSDEDHQILALVAAGLKDEAIARQLGLGSRTIQRRLNSLAQRMGANNRLDLVRTALHLGLV